MAKENIIIKENELLDFYKKNLKLPPIDDVVLLVIGGEFGIIGDYLLQNSNAPVIIFIEPNQQFFNNPDSLNKFKSLKQQSKKHIERLTVKQLEQKQNILLNLLVQYDIFGNGLEVIKNPFYEKQFPELINFEAQRLDNFLNSIKHTKKGLEFKYFDHLKNEDLTHLSQITRISENDLLKNFKNNAKIEKDGSLVIVIGNEFGFYAKELLKREKIYNLVFVEPVKDFCTFENKKIFSDAEILTENHIKAFFADKDEKNDYINFFNYLKTKISFINNVEILINPIYSQLYLEDVKKTIKQLVYYIKTLAFLKGNSMGDEFYGMMNSMYNLTNLNKLKAFKNKPEIDTIISVAAGPSLDDHMEELKDLSQKFPVIAADVVANKLVENGIIPDIVGTQERLYAISKYTTKFDDKIKKESIYIAPTLVHPYSTNGLDNVVLVSQNTKSSIEKYLSEQFYFFSDKINHSIYTGQFNISVALMFSPKNILLFGHDLAINNERDYAKGVKGGGYSIHNAKQEIGNRNQTVYITDILDKFRTNTETVLATINDTYKTNFFSFSDGARVKGIYDADKEDYLKFSSIKKEKLDLKKYLISVENNKKVLMENLEKEVITNQKLKHYFDNLKQLTQFTVESHFTSLVLLKETLYNKTIRLLNEEYLEKFSYERTDNGKWILQNESNYNSMLSRVENILEKTIKLLKKNDQLPTLDCSTKVLFDYYFFSPVRDKINQMIENNIEIDKEDLQYAALSYFYAFEPINFLKMAKVVAKLKKYNDKESQLIYYEGIEKIRCFYESQWKHHSNDTQTFFYRYQLASFNFEMENFKDVIAFLNDFNDLEIPEKILLAESYTETNQPIKAFNVFKEILLEDCTSLRVITNVYNLLITKDKLAEAKMIEYLASSSINSNEVFLNNKNLLQEKLKKLSSITDFSLKTSFDNDSIKNCQTMLLKFDTTKNCFVDHFKMVDFDVFMTIYAKTFKTNVYKLDDYTYQLENNEQTNKLDTTFFLFEPELIYKQ